MSVLVSNLAGKKLAEVAPVPRDVGELRLEVERLTGIPVALQKFVKDGDVLTSDAGELPQEGCELLCVRDETPMYTWDVEGNPDAEQLQAEGNVLRSPNMAHDFCNVLTKEPMRTGLHYYEFVLHKVGDEQWCGVTESKEVAGIRVDGRSLPAWTYYAGRAGRSGGSGSIHNGLGALHACSKAVVEFEKACDPGNVIGMLVDMDKRVVAFALDGRLQGACKVPGDEPLYVLTHMDTREDHVELRKPSLEEAPPANLEALSGALLDAEKGRGVPAGEEDSRKTMSCPLHVSPFMRGAALQSPSVEVRFKLAVVPLAATQSEASESATEDPPKDPRPPPYSSEVARVPVTETVVGKHIHQEALCRFGYFKSFQSFRSLEEIEGSVDVCLPASVGKSDIDGFVQFLYQGRLPCHWREIYGVWCLCDFLLAPDRWRTTVRKRLREALKGREDIENLSKLAEGSPEMMEFCQGLQRVIDVDAGELEQLLHIALRSEPESETRERVKGIVAASHETQAVSALLAVLQDPDPRLTDNYTSARRPMPRMRRNVVHHRIPAPDHGLDLPEPVFDLRCHSELLDEEFLWLWKQLVPHVKVASAASVEHFRAVAKFFASFWSRHVSCECTMLEPEEGGFRAVKATCEVPLMAIFPHSRCEVLCGALKKMLLIGCRLLASGHVTSQELLELLDCGVTNGASAMSALSLNHMMLCEVLHAVPGMHRSAVRKHLLNSKTWAVWRRRSLQPSWRDDDGQDALMSALLDMY